MSETYAPGGYASDGMERAGGVILVVVACLSAVLVIAGLIYATGATARHKAAVIAAGCEPNLFILALPCITQQMVISQYDGIANPASNQLAADMAAYRASERHNLVAAEAALRAEVATEQALDNSLAPMMFTPENRARSVALITNASSQQNAGPPPAAVTFTPKMTVVADAAVQADLALAKLTAEQARSTSLRQLRSFDLRVAAAAATLETEMKLLRKAVDAPLTSNP
jgi:hypothetical protein